MTRLISLFLLLLHEFGAETRSCYEGFLDPRKSMNIGQKWGHDLPAGTVHIDLHSVTRPYSAFELRTYDPEGVLIFGDSAGGRDWFLLGLRDGRPEIQIHNQLAKVTVNGGPRINDGAWHKVIVRSEDHRIVLEVDGEQSVRIGHVTERVTQNLYTVMRISVGGILINQTELLEPNLVLELGNTTSISSPFSVTQDCDSTIVTLDVTDTGVTLQVGGNKGHSTISETTYNALREAWQGEAKLLIGTDQYDADHFHGCLQDFLIQGEALDLDFALFRSDSIWPHSCPGSSSGS